MSIVCAIQDESGVWIGSDGRATSGDFIQTDSKAKWIEINTCLWVGFTGHYRIAELITLANVEKGFTYWTKKNILKFTKRLWRLCAEDGWKMEESKQGGPSCYDFNLILADFNSIHEVSGTRLCDFIPHNEFCGIGSGYSFAYGAAFALRNEYSPVTIIRDAIQAAIRYDTKCGGESWVHQVHDNGVKK